jgi:endonuclease/exonuclease/phosphatase family metal-dependent hydrolase
MKHAVPWALLMSLGCGGHGADATRSDDAGTAEPEASDAAPPATSGEFLALSYNVAGLPMGISGSMPEIFTPLIGPLLNAYDVVLLQESWETPDPNPGAPLRVYHEILVAASEHPHKSEPAEAPWGMDPERPDALLGDGLNMFSDFPFGETIRVRWSTCVTSAADCLALKGFSMTRMQLARGVEIDVYNLHMEAGGTPEDDAARDGGIDQLVSFMAEHSAARAILMGGDFNLHTDEEPAGSQFARLLDETGLRDACTELECDRPGWIDKFVFRSDATVTLRPEHLRFETDVFVSDEGDALSDHDPLAVRFAWSADP